MKKNLPSSSIPFSGTIIIASKKILQKAAMLFLVILLVANYVSAQQLQPSALHQIQSLMDEKASRTPAQKKISSLLWYAFKMRNGQALTREVATLQTGVVKDAQGRVKVEIDAVVTPQLLNQLRSLGAEIVFSSEKFANIVANIPLHKVEEAALLDAIKHINQWVAPVNNSGFSKGPGNGKTVNNHDAEVIDIPEEKNDKPAFNFNSIPDFSTRAANIRKQLNEALNKTGFNGNGFFIGSVTSEADVTHKAAVARAAFGTTGAGVKIGVLSNGVDGYATSQASGDLPPVITILPGQAGTGSEGRAMMELMHDLAPDADLYFATGFNGIASFAQNILDLRTAGCDIIVDDVSYLTEGVFQDDKVAQAVNTVTTDGALYFSSASNSGNKNDNTAGVWEGDFVDGGTLALFPGGNLNDFGGGTVFNTITAAPDFGSLFLKWSDPLGQSGNDYDLFVTNSTGTTIIGASTNVQDGNDKPLEGLQGTGLAGSRIYILKKTGEAIRALHLNTYGSRLNFNTPGATSGHNAAASAYTVAATPAGNSPYGSTGPYPDVFNSTNKVENFSSDGPRRMFFNPDGSEITPGNVLFGTNGGTVLQKPDITAADGTATATPGFNPFFGTSAAAPHAAAIAALIKSKFPSITPAQMRQALISTAIDIETPGVDRDAGAGIIMAYEALTAAGCIISSTNRLYVNASATGANNGTSWTDAFTDLQSALAAACSNITQIWVAAGTYYPDEGGSQVNNDRNATFTLKNGLAIYGGFAGTETELSGRNLKINATILSGDIDKDGTLANNAYHVTTASATNSTAVIDGFTIEGGNASDNGGGMLNDSGSPIISNCTFSGNFASRGGGLYNLTASPTITNCLFSGNAAGNQGGAMSSASSAPVLINCTISGNMAQTGNGGGLYSSLGSTTLTNCIIWNNRDITGTGTTASSIFNFASPLTISYSLVQGQNPGGTGNLDGTNAANDPLFVTGIDPLTAPTTAGDFHLQPGSPVIDAGSDAANATTTDLDGSPRKVDIIPGGSLIDMGAYEANPVPSASIANKSIIEGNSGTSLMKFKVTLNHAYGGTVKIKYATADSTATAGSDYAAAQGTINFKPGIIAKNISITINGDATKEANERFKVKLSNPSNALLSDSLGIGTIKNDDAAAFVSASTVNDSKVADAVSAKVMPNPNNGNFDIGLHLPANKANTTLQLYNNLGVKVWQEDLGMLSGSVNKSINLENTLAAGVYVMMIQRDDARYSIKVVISK